TTLLALPPQQHGFQNDPVLGLVEHLGIGGATLSVLKVYVGILAATILFIATNAGIIGASRITYSMATYRQLPEIFRRLHPKFKTPWLSILVFAGFISIIVLLPGQTDFLGTMYSFGAMLSFTVAHAAVIALRYRHPDDELQFRARPRSERDARRRAGARRVLRRRGHHAIAPGALGRRRHRARGGGPERRADRPRLVSAGGPPRRAGLRRDRRPGAEAGAVPGPR